MGVWRRGVREADVLVLISFVLGLAVVEHKQETCSPIEFVNLAVWIPYPSVATGQINPAGNECAYSATKKDVCVYLPL